MTGAWMIAAAIVVPPALLWIVLLPLLVRLERRLPPTVRAVPFDEEVDL